LHSWMTVFQEALISGSRADTLQHIDIFSQNNLCAYKNAIDWWIHS